MTTLMAETPRKIVVRGHNIVLNVFLFIQLEKNELTLVKNAYPKAAKVMATAYNPFRLEVAQEYEIGPGVYCVIPTTLEIGEEAEFLLRILTQQKTEIK